MAGARRRVGARPRPRPRPRGSGSLGNGNNAHRICSRAQAAKISMNRVTLLLLLAVAAPAAAQAPKAFTQTRQPGAVETDPIRCFWKTDRSNIIVGERFTLVLTCGIIET